MTCEMHEYYLVLHVHVHITSKNGDVCKLCPTERIFRLTWPRLWRHRSNFRGSGSWNFQGGRKKYGRKAIEKMVTIERLTKKIFQKNRRGGGCINPPPPLCRRGLRLDIFRTFTAISVHLACFSLDTEDQIFHWGHSFRCAMYTYCASPL